LHNMILTSIRIDVKIFYILSDIFYYRYYWAIKEAWDPMESVSMAPTCPASTYFYKTKLKWITSVHMKYMHVVSPK